MARNSFLPRKRRTREHIIADQSVNYVERYIIDEGHVTQKVQSDYGYDLFMATFDEWGYVEPDFVLLQLKASASLAATGGFFVHDVDIRDYNLWMLERNPVILVLFDAARRKAFWLFIQRYFQEDSSRRPGKGTRTVRVKVPKRQAINHRAIVSIRRLKNEFLAPFER